MEPQGHRQILRLGLGVVKDQPVDVKICETWPISEERSRTLQQISSHRLAFRQVSIQSQILNLDDP